MTWKRKSNSFTLVAGQTAQCHALLRASLAMRRSCDNFYVTILFKSKKLSYTADKDTEELAQLY